MSRVHYLLEAINSIQHQSEDICDMVDAWGMGDNEAVRAVSLSMQIAMTTAAIATDAVTREASRFPEENGERFGDFIVTASARRFWPLDPRADEVDVGDISHSLALKCRWGGFPSRFYGVDEHSQNVAHIARRLAVADGLDPDLAEAYGVLHDAEEAYLPDIPRPVKRHIRGWPKIAARVQGAILDALGLPPPPLEIDAIVQRADDIALVVEARMLFSPEAYEAMRGGIPALDPPEWARNHIEMRRGWQFPLDGAAFLAESIHACLERIKRTVPTEPAPVESTQSWKDEVREVSDASACYCLVCGLSGADPVFKLCDGCRA